MKSRKEVFLFFITWFLLEQFLDGGYLLVGQWLPVMSISSLHALWEKPGTPPASKPSMTFPYPEDGNVPPQPPPSSALSHAALALPL